MVFQKKLTIYINLMFKVFFIFFMISLSFSQNQFDENGAKNGLWFGKHENGQIKYQGHFFSGKEIG